MIRSTDGNTPTDHEGAGPARAALGVLRADAFSLPFDPQLSPLGVV